MAVERRAVRQIPSIDQLLQRESIRALVPIYSREMVIEETRRLVEETRAEALRGNLDEGEVALRASQIAGRLKKRLAERMSPSLRRVINAAGVILHTNVGRAPISPHLAKAMGELAGSYSNLEYNLEKGQRGHRDLHFESRATRLVGCEAATVANNNAAALFLILSTFAKGKNVLVSRGELIEIGGSFRLPSIMQASGAILREVGTTNKTRISDYREAIDEDTALMMRVHPSNYKVVGFTQAPELEEMVSLARETGIPLVEDTGSGYLLDTGLECLRDEPCVRKAVLKGVDIVCFSGDKLLGGPQAGIILGRRKFIQRIRKNPLMRACRIDKTTYAALEHILMEYESGRWMETVPVYRMLSMTREELGERAQRMAERLADASCEIDMVDGESLVGGGSAPEEKLPTRLLALRPTQVGASEVERRLRARRPPVIVRIEKGRILVDLRTVFERDEAELAEALRESLGGAG